MQPTPAPITEYPTTTTTTITTSKADEMFARVDDELNERAQKIANKILDGLEKKIVKHTYDSNQKKIYVTSTGANFSSNPILLKKVEKILIENGFETGVIGGRDGYSIYIVNKLNTSS